MIQAYVLNDVPVNIEHKYYLIEELNGNKPVIYNTTLQDGYVDVTSIENWHKFGSMTGKDFKFIREQIKAIMFEKASNDLSNWSELSTEEATICSQYMLVPKSLRDLYLTNSQQIYYSNLFDTSVNISRKMRFRYVMMFLYNNLSLQDCQSIVNKLRYVEGNNVVDLITNYIDYGIEGTIKNDPEAIYDFITSTPGTSFENTGLDSLTLTSWTETSPGLSSMLMEILEDGNYDVNLIKI